MNFYRRNTFHEWFSDVGFIYLLVIAVVALVYFLQNVELPRPANIDSSAIRSLFPTEIKMPSAL